MKKLPFIGMILISIQFITVMFAFSQVQNPVLVLIESPNFKILSTIQQLKNYYHDDDLVIAEFDPDDLLLLNRNGIQYQVLDANAWSAEYYMVSSRPFGPAINRLNIGDKIYTDAKRSIIKIEKDDEPELFMAGYQLEKINRINKPLPKSTYYTFSLPAGQDSTINDIINNVSADWLRSGVQRLQDFRTRYTYSDSIIPAAQWIYDQYMSFGYTDVKFDTFYLNNVPHRNVIATKTGLIYPDSVIMIGGHYDSIISGAGTNSYVFAPGADDNASGTIAAVEAARVLADYEFEATIKFVAWDAEEVGLRGSQAYAQKAYSNGESISLFINLDMIGNITPLYNVTIYADIPTMPLAELMASLGRTYTSLTPNIPGNSGGSDHRSFQNYGYRALFGQEGVFSPNWHRGTDLTSNMDFDYMKEVVQMSLATVVYLSGPANNFLGKPYVKYIEHNFSDDSTGASFGNDNGYVDAGETIELTVAVKNYGDSTAFDVTAELIIDDPFVAIVSAMQNFGTISSQQTAFSQGNYIFQVSPDAPVGHKIDFKLEIRDSQGRSWQDRVELRVMMPDLFFQKQNVSQVSGNGDQKIDPGEIFNLIIDLENSGLRDAVGITATLRCDYPSITILDSTASFSDIPRSGSGNNSNDRFTIAINADATPEIIPFWLKVSEGKGFYQKVLSFNLAIGQDKILLVEDDGRYELSYYYTNVLSNLGISYKHWNANEQGPVPQDTLIAYSRVIWYTGLEFNNSLFRHGTARLEHYLDQGGNLFINGSLFPVSVKDSLILSNYLHSQHINSNTNLHYLKSDGTKQVVGNSNFSLSTTGDNYQIMTGEVDVQLPAQAILFYDPTTSEGPGNIQSSGSAAAAVNDRGYRAVMFSFGWEGIAEHEIRQEILIKILNWLQGIETSVDSDLTNGSVPATFQLAQNYPNPFNPSTTIQFLLPTQNHVSIKIFNLLGMEIKTLVAANFNAGEHKVVWDGKDNYNQPVASGVYFYQMRVGDFQMTRKMVLMY